MRRPCPQRPSALLPLLAALCLPLSAAATPVVLDSFNPSGAGGLCGLGADATSGDVWVHGCSAATVQRYSGAGVFQSEVARPGESADDVDVELAPEPLVLGTTALPTDTLLIVNGESGTADIYAVDRATGAVLATLVTDFGDSHVVGGSYSAQRDSFFLVQDSVPGGTLGNTVAEIDPVTGAVLGSFRPIDAGFSVFFGDLEVNPVSGNLFLVSSAESTIAEFTPEGDLLRELALPAGVSGLSGIGFEASGTVAWVSGTGGTAWRLGAVPEPGTGLLLGFGLGGLGLARRRAR